MVERTKPIFSLWMVDAFVEEKRSIELLNYWRIVMTFNDDMIQLNWDGGTRYMTCGELGMNWPPLKEISVYGFVMILQSHSDISDRMRRKNPKVKRKAVYAPHTPTTRGN